METYNKIESLRVEKSLLSGLNKGLKCLVTDETSNGVKINGKVFTIDGVQKEDELVYWTRSISVCGPLGCSSKGFRKRSFKPVFFPLECMNDEVTIGGESFTPIDRLRKVTCTPEIRYEDIFNSLTLTGSAGVELNMLVFAQEIFDLLDEWHFNRRNLHKDQFVNAFELKVY